MARALASSTGPQPRTSPRASGIGIGGSDDHAGVDIGRTYSETPPARTPRDFLEHVRRGDVLARGVQGSAAKWAHAAIALAARSFASERAAEEHRERPDPARVMRMVNRLLREGDARRGAVGSDVTPDDARCLLRAWLSAVELDHLDERELDRVHAGGELQPRRPLPARLPPA